jgi:hypothetical protein
LCADAVQKRVGGAYQPQRSLIFASGPGQTRGTCGLVR